MPMPSISSEPSINGPIITPATKYAVTAGSFTSFASLESKRPVSNAIDKLKRIVAVDDKSTTFFL